MRSICNTSTPTRDKIRAQCYDLVCNGQESGSGSIRIHRADIQARVFDLLGISKEKQQERFGHILEAFSVWSAAARRVCHRH